MARHRTVQEKQELGERARALRAAGVARPDIKRQLGIGSELLQELLLDGREPAARRRSQRDPAVRQRAEELRRQGLTYPEIVELLGISRSTCSLWLRDFPHPADDPVRAAEMEARRVEALKRRLQQDREVIDVRHDDVAASAAACVGSVSPRDLALAAAVSYWCEGSKRKPWKRNVTVKWMNSDARLVLLYLGGWRSSASVRTSSTSGSRSMRPRTRPTLALGGRRSWASPPSGSRAAPSSAMCRAPLARTSATTTTGACACPCCAAVRCTMQCEASSSASGRTHGLPGGGRMTPGR